MKNVTIEKDGLLYNFGIRKPVMNSKELLSNHIWKDYLLNKWVCMRDDERNKYIFIKHVFDGKRVIQVIYSGEDYYGDGVYILYIVKIKEQGKDFYVDPIKFSLKYPSFEFASIDEYMSKVLDEGYITESEKNMLLNHKEAKEYAKNCYLMRDFTD